MLGAEDLEEAEQRSKYQVGRRYLRQSSTARARSQPHVRRIPSISGRNSLPALSNVIRRLERDQRRPFVSSHHCCCDRAVVAVLDLRVGKCRVTVACPLLLLASILRLNIFLVFLRRGTGLSVLNTASKRRAPAHLIDIGVR